MTDIAALIDRANKMLAIPAVPNPIKGGVSYLIPIDLFLEMRDALTRLTVPSLPEEIAGLINSAYAHAGDCEGARSQAFCDLATALHALAQKNERQTKLAEAWQCRHRLLAERYSELAQENQRLFIVRPEIIRQEAGERIRELEAECDHTSACVSMLVLCGEQGGKREDEQPVAYLRRLIDALIKAEAERDAVVKDSIKAALAWKAESSAACDAIEAATIERCIAALYEVDCDHLPKYERAIRAIAKPSAMCGFVTLNDPHVIADAQERIKTLETALLSCRCPRPANAAPDDITIAECMEREECGCDYGTALAKPT